MPEKSKSLKSQAQKVRIYDEFYPRLAAIADEYRHHGTTVTGLANEAIQQWLQRASANYKPPEEGEAPKWKHAGSTEHEQLHKWLQEILQSGNRVTIEAITANIKSFVVQVKLFAGNPDTYLEIEKRVEDEGNSGTKAG